MEQEQTNQYPPVGNAEAALRHFKLSLASGKHWYLALLETIGQWTDETETLNGREYHYLIQGEAFDWLLLAGRLCDAVDGLIPDDEKLEFLLRNNPPIQISPEEFKDLIGPVKYRNYLNYFYGITVEEALIQVVREEVRKEHHSNCWARRREGEEDEAFMRIYGETHSSLLRMFRKEKHIHLNSGSSVSEMKEFTYWSFKYRVKECEKAKVASDTQKALGWLRKNGYKNSVE